MHRWQFSQLAVGTAAVLLLFGCGGPDENLPQTAPVVGTVVFQGEPLSRGTVRFFPESGDKPATGVINQDGTFALSTFGDNDGAVVGAHTATVSAYADNDAGDGLSMTSLVPAKYTNQTQSPLKYDVKEGAENKFELVIE